MKIENITLNQFKRLKRYVLDGRISSIECELYLMHSNSQKRKLLLKKYKKNYGEYFGNKLLTVNSLVDYKDAIGIDELIMPENLTSIDKQIVGLSVPLIENNTNLSLLLNNNSIPLEEKIKWLNQVGTIIDKVSRVKINTPFFLGDIHESNFILDHNSNKILCVDLDGCKISNNKIYSMKYGSFNEKFFDLPKKYPLDEDDEPIPNNNTELYCYTMIILNTIAGGSINKLMIEDYYKYIQFLSDLGFPKEILDCFINLYSNKKNYSPQKLLETIPNIIEKASLDIFLEKNDIKRLYKTL